jgi:RING finger protein 113A
MFRKPKKVAKAGLRRKQENDDDDDDEEDKETTRELQQARKKAKKEESSDSQKNDNKESSSAVMHHFETSKETPMSQKDMATRTNQHHPTQTKIRTNKLLAGPIKAPTNIRTTCRFDYQPDICKDYKDTGFCGFGDGCIYLHDRGDTLAGWQIEQEWEQQQQLKKKRQQEQMEAFMSGGKTKDDDKIVDDDGIPFACFLCRDAFTEPVVTTCGHYFCQTCILKQVKESNLCPVCSKDTHGVFNEPTKLLSKKRKLLGRDASWQDYMEACRRGKEEEE